ncbi:class I SAM-dependent methyltransferase [Paludisphaera rhizosphaerae]|uniref:class I SAM-dependent methyltransferase n=1 Tax=Paludisphaera rhizosphaerae TaxID=2711216 RepID=UPI0013ED1C74|nr:class I SAM-dependent methyltransferase [Paludisphaera rhizosphaerae]
MMDSGKIAAIRGELQRIGCLSACSPAFQNQLLSYLDMNADQGDFLVEVGCYRGGMTAQLAHFAVERGKQFYVVDVDREYLDAARQTVETALGRSPACVHYVETTLNGFFDQPRPSNRCIMVFIDGDHHYRGVVRDIRAVVNSRLERPLSIGFHDYGLRCTAADELDIRVDRAIHDHLKGCAVIPMGEVAGLGGILPTSPVGDNGAHFPPGVSEGVVVVFNAPRRIASRLDRGRRHLKRLVRAALHASRGR